MFFQKLFQEFGRKGREQELLRLFRVVFRLGQSSCHRLVPMDLFRSEGYDFRELDPAQVCSVYAEQICETQYYLGRYALERLMALSQGQPAFLSRAFGYHKAEFDNGLLVLYAGYFYEKYGREKGADDREAGISRKRNRRRRAAW